MVKKDVALKLWYTGIANRSGKKKATVTVARKPLVLLVYAKIAEVDAK